MHRIDLLFLLLFTALLVRPSLAARTLPEGPDYEHFVFGVYIDSVMDYTDVPMTKTSRAMT